MIKNRKFTLDQRVTRLENAIKMSYHGMRRKFEGANIVRYLETALDDNLGEFYNTNVTARGGRLIVEIDDGEPEWSIRGTFEVIPTKIYYEVNVLDGAGKLEYELGIANNIEEAAELIAEEINKWAIDL